MTATIARRRGGAASSATNETMPARSFVGTNVLPYAEDSRDPEKQRAADEP